MVNSLKKFMVVEDSEAIQIYHKEMIEELVPDAKVIIAENAAQAIHMFFKEPTDVILLDMMMPKMGGKTFLDIMQEGLNSELIDTVPYIYIVTGMGNRSDILCIKNLPVVKDVILKPLTTEKLSSILDELTSSC